VGGQIVAIELDYLHSHDKLPGVDIFSLMHYDE